MEMDAPPEKTIEEKEKEIQRKKKVFDRTLVLGLILIGLSTAGLIAVAIINKSKPLQPSYTSTTSPTPTTTPTPTVAPKTKLYKSDDLKLSFEYPSESTVSESVNADTKKVEKVVVNYSVKASTASQTTTGYSLTITKFTAPTKTLAEVTATKKGSFALSCPATAQITPIQNMQLNAIDAETFSVRDCNGDLTLTYVPRFFAYYEIQETAVGDIGFRQQYEQITQEMVDSIRFYSDQTPTPAANPYVTYTSETYGFSFKHLKYDDSCCDVSGPESANAIKLVVLAKPETVVNRNNFDGVGIFVDTLGTSTNFGDYLTKQKQALTDDYVIVKGAKPTTQDSQVSVGDKTGTLLHGYTWQGTDLIYVPLGTANSNAILIISVKNTTGSFAASLQDILSSFMFRE